MLDIGDINNNTEWFCSRPKKFFLWMLKDFILIETRECNNFKFKATIFQESLQKVFSSKLGSQAYQMAASLSPLASNR